MSRSVNMIFVGFLEKKKKEREPANRGVPGADLSSIYYNRSCVGLIGPALTELNSHSKGPSTVGL